MFNGVNKKGEIVPGVTEAGENKAWDILGDSRPEDVCKTASASYDAAAKLYLVKSYGMDFSVSLKDKTISSAAPGSEVLLHRLGDFFRLSLLWYLVNAKEVPCTGRLVKLEYVKGGEIFTKGSHKLPLEKIALKFGNNKTGFIEKGTSLGGEITNLADASVRLYPLPRIPVVLTLWTADDEFPARSDLLLDSTCGLQVPTDIIWSVAMMSVLVML